jgi:nitrogen fixation protein
MRLKIRKQRRLISWLLVFMMVLNVFSPLNNVWAEGLDASNDGSNSIIEISNKDNVATDSQAHKPDSSGGKEKTDVPEEPDEVDEGQSEPTTATDSNASAPSGIVKLLPELMKEGPKDVTELLGDILISIKQNGSSVTEIIAGQKFTVEGSFNVPVEGDNISDPDQYVSYGDYAILPLDDSITIEGLKTLDLTFNGEKVGTLTFSNNQARIDFDGDVLKDPGISNVNCEFGANMKYTGTDVTEENPKENVWILGKQFTIKAPEVPITQTQTKSGRISDDKTQIEWTVIVNAKKTSDISLLGYKFQDTLTDTYVDNSFKINGIEPSPKVIPDASNKLSYEFNDVKGEQTITFSTKIPAETLIVGGTINNTAKFGKDTLVNTNTVPITIQKKTLIKKEGKAGDGLSGGTYNPNDRTITWTITVNQDQIPLQDLTVTDNLPTTPSGLSWKSAKWEYESAANTWSDLTTGDGLTVPTYQIEPAGGKYTLSGTTSKKVRLTIVCDVANDAYVGAVKTYQNTASLTWTGKPNGTFSDSYDVGIGFDSLTKDYVSTDYLNRQIKWTATVDLKKQLGYNDPASLKVYDLLIYGNSVSMDSTNLNTLVGGEYKKLTPKYGQKVVDNSWSNGLTYAIQPVMVNDIRVGDLLVVSGFNTDKPYTFTFETQVLNPNIFAANTGKEISNTASLYYGTVHLDDGNDKTTYNSNVLSKQVLKAGTETGTIGTSDNGFNSLDKTAVFRLNINTDGYNLTDADIESGKLGKVTVTDTLPAGWSFIDIKSDVKYELYTSSGTPVTDDSDIIESYNISDQSASFVFNKLENGYYILVKAKLSDDQYMKYLEASYLNGKTDSYQTATNTVKMTAEGDKNWNPGTTTSVKVPTQFLIKNVNTGKEPLEWTIKFNPYDLPNLNNVKITDKIPVGLELPFERDGSLDLTAFRITEYDQMVNGAFPTAGGRVLTTEQLQGRISYDKVSRVLTFTPTDGKLYLIVYTTEVTGNVGSNLKNQVAVSGSSIDGTGTNATYQVDSSHASATLVRNGYLDIRKVNAQNQIINGAVFTLYSDKTLQNPVITSVMRPDGTLRITPIPAPKAFGDPAFTYYLKETKVPDTYESDNMIYVVTVAKDSNNKTVTTVAGKAAGEILTVVNYQPDTVGNLSIRKMVEGNAGDINKDFNFTVRLTGQNIDGTYNYIGYGNKENGQLTITGGLGTVQLKHNESITITGLPKDTTYLVNESNYSGDGYHTSFTGEQGKIEINTTQDVEFTNTKYLPGSLIIKKAVGGNTSETGPFEFTVTFTKPDGTPDGSFYDYTVTGDALTKQIKNGGTLSLSGGQSAIITGLPKDTTYTVIEKDYSESGYSTISTGTTGIIETDTEHTASFTNTKYLPGSLVINKTVAGNTNETGPFEFTLAFTKPDGTADDNSYDYTITGDALTKQIKDGGTITLSDGQSAVITGLPKDTTYTVTEKDYSTSGYSSAFTGSSGKIETDKVQTAAFINTKYLPGSLTIKKTVAGNSNETGPFDFLVTFTKPNGAPDDSSYDYTVTGDAMTRHIKSGGTISLSDGQSATITGLPKDTDYTVTEKDYSTSGYSTASTGASGTIKTDVEQVAAFINTKILPGSLTISKTVAGSGADTKKKFDFTVTFKASGTYSYTGKGVPDGTIKSGDKISLADGESITITGLPDGTVYQVTEANYASERYTATQTGDTGIIYTLETSTAAFTNTYRKSTSSGGGGGGGGGKTPSVKPKQPDPTTPTEPSTPTPNVKPREEMTPQELYDVYGEVPRGYMVGPDSKLHTPQEIYDIWGQVPLGYMVGSNGTLRPIGLPKTGDDISNDIIIYGFLFISTLLGVTAMSLLRRKHSDK